MDMTPARSPTLFAEPFGPRRGAMWFYEKKASRGEAKFFFANEIVCLELSTKIIGRAMHCLRGVRCTGSRCTGMQRAAPWSGPLPVAVFLRDLPSAVDGIRQTLRSGRLCPFADGLSRRYPGLTYQVELSVTSSSPEWAPPVSVMPKGVQGQYRARHPRRPSRHVARRRISRSAAATEHSGSCGIQPIQGQRTQGRSSPRSLVRGRHR
jgi:hypothetical protein